MPKLKPNAPVDLETCSLCTVEIDDAKLRETDMGRICPDCVRAAKDEGLL